MVRAIVFSFLMITTLAVGCKKECECAEVVEIKQVSLYVDPMELAMVRNQCDLSMDSLIVNCDVNVGDVVCNYK